MCGAIEQTNALRASAMKKASDFFGGHDVERNPNALASGSNVVASQRHRTAGDADNTSGNREIHHVRFLSTRAFAGTATVHRSVPRV